MHATLTVLVRCAGKHKHIQCIDKEWSKAKCAKPCAPESCMVKQPLKATCIQDHSPSQFDAGLSWCTSWYNQVPHTWMQHCNCAGWAASSQRLCNIWSQNIRCCSGKGIIKAVYTNKHCCLLRTKAYVLHTYGSYSLVSTLTMSPVVTVCYRTTQQKRTEQTLS